MSQLTLTDVRTRLIKKWKRIAGMLTAPFVILYLFIMFLLFGDPQEKWET